MNRNEVIGIILIVVVIGGIFHFMTLDSRREFEEFQNRKRAMFYVDELILWKNSRIVFNSTDADEVIQWAMDNHNGSDAIIWTENGMIYVNMTRGPP